MFVLFVVLPVVCLIASLGMAPEVLGTEGGLLAGGVGQSDED